MKMYPLLSLAFAFASGSLLFGQDRTLTFRPPKALNPVVTGAPYCADEVSESFQTLNDGTYITQSNKQYHICRDYVGRTMRERDVFPGAQPTSGGNIKVVEILDPVAGVQYTLDSQHRIAYRGSGAATRTTNRSTRSHCAGPGARRAIRILHRVARNQDHCRHSGAGDLI